MDSWLCPSRGTGAVFLGLDNVSALLSRKWRLSDETILDRFTAQYLFSRFGIVYYASARRETVITIVACVLVPALNHTAVCCCCSLEQQRATPREAAAACMWTQHRGANAFVGKNAGPMS